MHDDARGAFESGDAAFGVTMERARFAFTPEDDRLFALGFPNLVVPVDETVDRKKVTTPKQAHRKWDIMEWPAELVMLAIHDPDLILGSHLTKPLAWATKPKAAKAVKPFVASCFTTYRIGERMLYLAEAYWGTRAVADAAVSYLESRTYKQWISSAFETYGSQAVRGLHFVLLRGRKTRRKAWLKRLEAAYAKFADRLQKSGPYGYGTVGDKSSRPFEQLDVTLHGREGVARSGYRCWLRGDEYGQPSFRDLACAIDDPKWVAATVDAHIAESQPNDKGYGEVNRLPGRPEGGGRDGEQPPHLPLRLPQDDGAALRQDPPCVHQADDGGLRHQERREVGRQSLACRPRLAHERPHPQIIANGDIFGLSSA